MVTEQLRREVFEFYRRAYASSLMTGTSGNASVYDREKNIMAITPSGLDCGKMSPEDIVLMDLNGEIISGELRPSSEWRMHSKIYSACPEFSAVMHTHSVNAAAFAVCGMPIPEILVEMRLFLGGAVPVCGYAKPGSWELGEKVAAALSAGPVCLMQNHGVAAAGRTMEEAYIRALYTEEAAEIYLKASLLGKPKELPEY